MHRQVEVVYADMDSDVNYDVKRFRVCVSLGLRFTHKVTRLRRSASHVPHGIWNAGPPGIDTAAKVVCPLLSAMLSSAQPSHKVALKERVID